MNNKQKIENLKILEFLKSQNIKSIESIVFDIDKKYPSQVSSHSLIINFDKLQIKLEPIGHGTHQSLKVGYNVMQGKTHKNYNDFKGNKILLNSIIDKIDYVFKESISELQIHCQDGFTYCFYCADYNIRKEGSFSSSKKQNLVLTKLN